MNAKTCVTLCLALLVPAATTAAPEKGGSGPLRPEVLKAMSLEDMLGNGEAAVREMNEITRQVLDSLADARKENDFQRMNCIGNVLNTIKGLLRLSDQNALSLRERVIGRDRSGAEHEFVKISIARGKVLELQAQAKGCGGPSAETVFEGAPLVEKVFDKDLPLENPRTGLIQPAVTIEPPPSASPYF